MKRIPFLLSVFFMLVLASSALAVPENYVVKNGDRTQKKVAITVDDGWNIDMVHQIHALSVELDFPITWFMVGYNFVHEDRDFWYDVLAHGSEIGNHTWKHSKLNAHSAENARAQVQECQERVDEVLGFHYPLRLLRPPYGEYRVTGKSYLPIFERLGVEKVVLWDVSQTNAQKAFKATKNGSILLYHSNKKDMNCLKELVPMLRADGYELVTVSDLLGLAPLELPAFVTSPEASAAPTALPAVTATAETTVQPVSTPTPAPASTPVPAAVPTAAEDRLTEDDVIEHGDRNVSRISITVDDCNDPAILKKMHELSVELDFPITYFVIGNQFQHKDKALWEEILNHGSELGSHTWKHSTLTAYSTSNAETQLRKCQERVDEVLGYHYPLRLMRPPQGKYKAAGKNFLSVFEAHGVEKVILWDVKQTNAQKALQQTQNGSILVFETNKTNYHCLAELIPLLKNAGYELVTVSDLLHLEPIPLQQQP